MRMWMVFMCFVLCGFAIWKGESDTAFWPLIICATVYAVGSGIMREIQRR